MKDEQLSINFRLSEFGYVRPTDQLLYILQYIRTESGCSVRISSGPREVSDHVRIYKDLEKQGKIKTVGNGLGKENLIDIIPWASRHLPTHAKEGEKTGLHAVDIVVKCPINGLLTGLQIEKFIHRCIETDKYKEKFNAYLGVGIGHYYSHIDTGRTKPARWGYPY